MCREIPLAEAVRSQIEVQKTLQEQLEVNSARTLPPASILSTRGPYSFRLRAGAEEAADENRSTGQIPADHTRESTTQPLFGREPL